MNRLATVDLSLEIPSAQRAYHSQPDPLAIGPDISAMLNESGGLIRIEGADASQIIREILTQILPEAPVGISTTADDLGSAWVLDVPRGPKPPYAFDGHFYMRTGEFTHEASRADLTLLIQRRIGYDRDWDQQPALEIGVEELDLAELQRTARDRTGAGVLTAAVEDRETLLHLLHLLVDLSPCRAAVVAFASQPLPWYPQCALRLARFKGTNKDEFLDYRQLTGHAFKLLSEADMFLKRHLPVIGRFEPGLMERQDQPLYPPLALREALVNALVHRDYSINGGAVSVAVYDDRLEIISTGTLPFGLTVGDLRGEHSSRPRNPILADLFHRRGLIERWGRGTRRMIELCLAAGLAEPEFEERAGDVVVRFLAKASFGDSIP